MQIEYYNSIHDLSGAENLELLERVKLEETEETQKELTEWENEVDTQLQYKNHLLETIESLETFHSYISSFIDYDFSDVVMNTKISILSHIEIVDLEADATILNNLINSAEELAKNANINIERSKKIERIFNEK